MVGDAGEDDGPTEDLGGVTVPTYEEAAPTLESMPAFGARKAIASLKPTTPGMPALIAPDPKIAPAVIVPAVVVGTPEDLAGPTAPDGYALTASGEGPGPWIDAPPTEPDMVLPRPTPAVPPPGSPTFEISKSLEMESAKAIEMAKKAREVPKTKRRHHGPQAGPGPHAPTYQMLPALKKTKPEREGSDWPLVLGLVGLFLVIALLVGVVAYSMVSPSAPAAPAPAEPAAR